MKFEDDTPSPGALPEIYPKFPPANVFLTPDLLAPDNFFAFEGIDGTGKTTIIRRLIDRFEKDGRKTHNLRLGKSDVTAHALERAKWLNSNPMTFSLLVWISVYEALNSVRAYLNTEDLIFFDRYCPTVRVRGILEGLPTHYMDLIEKGLSMPRKIFLVESDLEICCKRIIDRGRGVSYFEAGSRIVDNVGDAITETDISERRSDAHRSDQLFKHLTRMKNELRNVLASYPNVVLVNNNNELDDAIDQVFHEICFCLER